MDSRAKPNLTPNGVCMDETGNKCISLGMCDICGVTPVEPSAFSHPGVIGVEWKCPRDGIPCRLEGWVSRSEFQDMGWLLAGSDEEYIGAVLCQGENL